jgi:hypothetical protein
MTFRHAASREPQLRAGDHLRHYLEVRDWKKMAAGEMFSDRDVRNGNKVCVIGNTVRQSLFPKASPIGKEIRINNVAFRVIGVLSRKGANMVGMDQDNRRRWQRSLPLWWSPSASCSASIPPGRPRGRTRSRLYATSSRAASGSTLVWRAFAVTARDALPLLQNRRATTIRPEFGHRERLKKPLRSRWERGRR